MVERYDLVAGRDDVHARGRALEFLLEPRPLRLPECVGAVARELAVITAVEQDELHLAVGFAEDVACVGAELGAARAGLGFAEKVEQGGLAVDAARVLLAGVVLAEIVV